VWWLVRTRLLSLPTHSIDAQDEAAQRVSLMTLHSAKGLEFGNVFFAGFEDGIVPLIRCPAHTASYTSSRVLGGSCM